MKRFLALATAIALLVSTVTVLAAPSLAFDVTVDYDNHTINVEYTTDGGYASKVTVVVHNADGEPAITDYVRIYEGDAAASGSDVVKLTLGDDIATGSYTVKVTLGGKNSASDTKQVYIIGNSDALGYLAAINAATAADINSKLAPVKDVIGITFDGIYATNQPVVDAALVSIRTNDCAGAFSSLTAVGEGFNKAKAVAAVKTSVDAATLKTNVENNGAALGIDLENPEYVKYADKACELIFAAKQNINDGTSAAEVFDECVAVAAVTSCKPSEADAYFTKYAKQLKIEAYMTQYASSEKAKVARLVQEANCTTADEVALSFANALDAVDDSSNNTVHVPSGGGGGGSVISGPAITPEPSAPAKVTFGDISDTEWAREYIETLATMGIVNGYDDGSFRGNGTVTREEFVKMLVCAFELELGGASCSFDDVAKSNWAYDYIAAAVSRQIISGVSDSEFGFGEGITRQDMAVILFRLAKLNGLEVDENLDVDPFPDHDAIADYAREGVYVMRQTGIVNGFDDGSFKPLVTLTRAEAAKVICQMLKVKY